MHTHRLFLVQICLAAVGPSLPLLRYAQLQQVVFQARGFLWSIIIINIICGTPFVQEMTFTWTHLIWTWDVNRWLERSMKVIGTYKRCFKEVQSRVKGSGEEMFQPSFKALPSLICLLCSPQLWAENWQKAATPLVLQLLVGLSDKAALSMIYRCIYNSDIKIVISYFLLIQAFHIPPSNCRQMIKCVVPQSVWCVLHCKKPSRYSFRHLSWRTNPDLPLE